MAMISAARTLKVGEPALAGLLAAAFGALALGKGASFSLSNVALATLGISGTMVALVLPAAELFQKAMEQAIEHQIKQLFAARAEAQEARERQKGALVARGRLQEIKSIAAQAWRGSLYVFGAFVLSVAAMFEPRVALSAGEVLRVDLILLSLALGLLLVGAGLFLLTAHWVFGFRFLDDVLVLVEKVVAEEGEKDAADGSARPVVVGTEQQANDRV